jgi:ABC-type nickel/cobalt efflux system permease component RcnA
MRQTELWMLTGLFAIIIGIGSWLLATVVVNSSRISVAEQRLLAHDELLTDIKVELRAHRQHTELSERAQP